MSRHIKRLIFVAILTLLTGCSTMRAGGAPDPSFDLESDLQKIAAEFESATNITNFYKTRGVDRVDARNRFISGRLVQIDLQYLKFIRALTSDKQQIDAATDVALLTINLAGTLVGGTRAKTNLAAAAAAIAGTKTIIDKDFYYEKSIESLVATMNAKRKEMLVGILGGLTQSVDNYPFERALTDIHQYYLAGTLNGAIQFINAQAAQSDAESTKALNVLYKLAVPTTAQIADIAKLTDAIGAAGLTLDKAQKALKSLGVADADLPQSLEDTGGKTGAKEMLKQKVRAAKNLTDDTKRDAAVKAITEAFKSAGMIS